MSYIPVNEIICGRNETVMALFPAECIDLTVTSPPYDGLRAYKGSGWDFETTARELWRVTKRGGVVVWVVADATVNGGESGTSFRQALAFMALGFRLHDTMIYRPTGLPPYNEVPRRYVDNFEYMFVFSKGQVKTFNALKDRKNASFGRSTVSTRRERGGELTTRKAIEIAEYALRTNIWDFARTNDDQRGDHPATFPDDLAEDHILSWSNPGDVVLDPFVGSGTTPKMAIRHNRQFIGIDISPEYCDLARRRIAAVDTMMELFA
jgi:DNA modification methylase